MSVQFGRWNFEGQPATCDYLDRVNAALATFGPDSSNTYSKGGVQILYRAFHTTRESYRELQPHVSSSGTVITWDGRLDNRIELMTELRESLEPSTTDLDIVAAAYEKYGTNCLKRLIGDWALSVWNPDNRSLTLAKDPIGTRHLYYLMDRDQISWSTVLDALLLFSNKTFTICEEYIAGWMSYFPATHLTPYAEVRSVPPSSAVFVQSGQHSVRKYWDFDPAKKIRYRTDTEYEEHFRTVFAVAVQRRLRADRPVLAELSGGMDSSSIVCMADVLTADEAADNPRLDTISWDVCSDPQMLNEYRYFKKVEEKRGRTGYHIALDAEKCVGPRTPLCDVEWEAFAAVPVPSFRRSDSFKQFEAHMRAQAYRIVISGIGGESATGGGVPTAKPELQNLLARARVFALARQLKAWAVKTKKSRLLLLWEAARGFCVTFSVPDLSIDVLTIPWFDPEFVMRNRAALRAYPFRVKLFGPLPSFQTHLAELDSERRLLAFYILSPDLLHEVRYPYFDRNLLEFMYAVPQEQIVRVGQRRSLMKRSLVGIVPEEILRRRRRAPALRESLKDNSTSPYSLLQLDRHIIGAEIGIFNGIRLAEALRARSGDEGLLETLGRTLLLESWLRHLTTKGVLRNEMINKDTERSFAWRGTRSPREPSRKFS